MKADKAFLMSSACSNNLLKTVTKFLATFYEHTYSKWAVLDSNQ